MKPIKTFIGIALVVLAMVVTSRAQSFLTNGLVAYYPFDGNANDASGNGNNGTMLTGNFVKDRFGRNSSAFEIPATNTGWNWGIDTLIDSQFSTNLTLALWFKLPSGGGGILMTHGISGFVDPFISTTKGELTFRASAPQYWLDYHDSSVTENQWHSVVATISGNSDCLYLDGKLVLSGSNPSPSSTGTWKIGPMGGDYDSVRIYNRALSPLEVSALYSLESTPPAGFETNGLVAYYAFNGNAYDETVNENNGTTHNVTFTTNRYGLPNAACNFNGIDSFIQLGGSLSISGPRTFTAWIYPNNNSTGMGFPIIVGGVPYNGDFFSVGNADSIFNSQFLDHWGSGLLSSQTPLFTNTWYQVALVYDGANIKFYLDGKIDGTVNGNLFNYSINTITIGGNLIGGTTVGGFFAGLIDDVRIYNRALSSSEMAALYASELPTYPPSITTNPVNFYANGNQPASFNVTATGSDTLSYQWQFNGTNLLNGTNPTLTIASVKPSNLGQYFVIITNAYGGVTSSVANLFMYPYLNAPFNGVVTYWGQTNTLSVGAWGSGALSYQWYFNGVPINGATSATLPLGAIQFTNAGQYSVVVSSSLGCVTNAPYQVVVNPANVSIAIRPDVVVQGTVGYNYTIQSTADLGNTNAWITETNLTLPTAIYDWVDLNSDASKSSPVHKYYRVIAGQ